MIKKIIYFSIVFITANHAQDSLVLNLEKSISLALEHNNDLKIARLDKEKADEQVDEAWGSAIFPTIDGSVYYNRAIKRGVIIIDAPEFGFTGSFPQGTENTMTISANLEQPIFTGAVFLAVRVAKTYAEITDKMYDATKEELIVNVKKAYYSILLSKEVLELSKLNLQLAKDNLKNTESMYNAGIVPEYDFVRAKVHVQNIIPEVQQAENSLLLSKNMLKIVTGLNLEQNVSVNDSLEFTQIENQEYSEAKNILLNKNNLLKQLQLQVELQDDAASYEFTKHFPELYFIGNWQSQAQENDPRPFNKWRYQNSLYVGLNLRVPIFNGFQTTSKVQQAEIDFLKAKEQLEKSKKNLKNKLEEVMLNIDNTMNEINSYQAAIEQAQLGYDIASKRFTSGISNQLEVVDAIVSLSRSKVNYLTSVYDYYILHAELNRLLSSD